ncbi:MAG: hypothetical protein UY94_C0023G0005 [Parcubacteria group bacterium GW2011_GWA2_56_21]|nr:MAG: hypothetical protein UY94_C0023G0005 [Parcubacteria group bacterium GW2011_GWA2_56_21]
MKKVIQTLRELEAEAADFVRSLMPEAGATLVTLSGELGAGKTAFTKSVAKAFGVEETVNSPTFVLEKIYFLPRELGGRTSKFARLVHIDAYRLEKGSDLAALGFDELLQDPGNLIMLEWPENVAEALPAPAVRVMLTALPDGSHTLAYG